MKCSQPTEQYHARSEMEFVVVVDVDVVESNALRATVLEEFQMTQFQVDVHSDLVTGS